MSAIGYEMVVFDLYKHQRACHNSWWFLFTVVEYLQNFYSYKERVNIDISTLIEDFVFSFSNKNLRHHRSEKCRPQSSLTLLPLILSNKIFEDFR